MPRDEFSDVALEGVFDLGDGIKLDDIKSISDLNGFEFNARLERSGERTSS